jgi:thiosulfate/3-mercaptopyruvate sulfurtransferase
VVGPEWVAERLTEGLPGVLLDARHPDAYAQGHLAGAVSLHSEKTWIGSPPESLMLDVSGIGKLMTAHGISFGEPVYIYDDGKYLDAARLFWVLEVHGHPDVHVIEGGLQRWAILGYALESEPNSPRSASEFVPVLQAQHLATTEDVFRAIDSPAVLILDARPTREWEGLVSKTSSNGHIPSSWSHQWCKELLMFDEGMSDGVVPASGWCDAPQLGGAKWLSIRSGAELSSLVAEKTGSGGKVIAYCNRGKQSAVIYLALRCAGVDVAAYNGSWIEWCRESALPVEMPK